MRLELGGHPLHTRALTVVLRAEAGGLTASADLVDLRQRGFTPVGSAVQGAGIIHQMGLDVRLAAGGRTIEAVAARQPVVAFEASPGTLGESCRDVVPRLARLRGAALDDPAALRAAMAGAAGCSHLLAAGQFLCATLTGEPLPAAAPDEVVHRQVRRRDLVFQGHELADGRLAIGIQLGDLHTAPAPAGERPMARFRRHDELRVRLVLAGWPATIVAAGSPPFRAAAASSTACCTVASPSCRCQPWKARPSYSISRA